MMAAMIIAAATQTPFAQFRETRPLTNNNIIALAGSGDTLWLATERGFNYRTSIGNQDGWAGFEVNDLKPRFRHGLAFGGGGAAALIDREVRSSFTGFWHFDHAGGKQRQTFFQFPLNTRGGEDGKLANPTGSLIYAYGNFWAAFGSGGMVRYDPQSDSAYAIRPGDENETPPQNIADDDTGRADSRRVLSLDFISADNRILVTTPSTLWAYDPGNKNWETLYTKPELSSAEFVSYCAAFVINKKDSPAMIYSSIAVTRGNVADTMLYVSEYGSDRWFAALDDRARFSVFPAVNGAMYILSYDNRVSLLADTSAAGAARENLLSEILAPAKFREMLASAGNAAPPDINDILFLPRNDSTGTLAVATESGLYVCESAEPLADDYGAFTLYRHVREVKAGEAYALPGIIRYGTDSRYEKCVFVYKLKKDGDVTIKVYDYNMSLVRTVVKGARRNSKTERSTVPSRDVWDGKNEAGRRASPGVYYFKITSTGGDRFLGKVILAK
jgi:hypothetical protein